MGALLEFGPAGKGRDLTATVSGSRRRNGHQQPGRASTAPPPAKRNSTKARSIILTATPKPGSAFVGWSGGLLRDRHLLGRRSTRDPSVNAEFGPAPSRIGAAAARAPGGDGAAQAGLPRPAAGSLRLGRAPPRAPARRAAADVPGSRDRDRDRQGPEANSPAHLDAGRLDDLRLRLSRAGRRALARSKTDRLALRVASPSSRATAARQCQVEDRHLQT